MPLPLVNAAITKIEGGGTSEDYDAPAGADTVRWLSNADAYITEKIETAVAVGTGASSLLEQGKFTRMVVNLDPGEFVKRGDTITYDYAGEIGLIREVRDVQRYQLFGTVVIWFVDT